MESEKASRMRPQAKLNIIRDFDKRHTLLSLMKKTRYVPCFKNNNTSIEGDESVKAGAVFKYENGNGVLSNEFTEINLGAAQFDLQTKPDDDEIMAVEIIIHKKVGKKTLKSEIHVPKPKPSKVVKTKKTKKFKTVFVTEAISADGKRRIDVSTKKPKDEPGTSVAKSKKLTSHDAATSPMKMSPKSPKDCWIGEGAINQYEPTCVTFPNTKFEFSSVSQALEVVEQSMMIKEDVGDGACSSCCTPEAIAMPGGCELLNHSTWMSPPRLEASMELSVEHLLDNDVAILDDIFPPDPCDAETQLLVADDYDQILNELDKAREGF